MSNDLSCWQAFTLKILSHPLINTLLGIVIGWGLSQYQTRQNLKRQSIGALQLVNAEMEKNTEILKQFQGSLEDVFLKNASESEATEVNQVYLVGGLPISADRLRDNAYYATHASVGNLENTTLLERVLNVYSRFYDIQDYMRLGVVQSSQLDQFSKLLSDSIQYSAETSKQIRSEIRRLLKKKL